jgi:hypothetical protein
VAIVFACLLLAVVANAEAGVIRGTLNPKATAVSKHVRPGRSGVTDAVIYIERLPEVVERKLNSHGFWLFRKVAPPRVRTLVLMNRRFDPHVLAITVGDRIAFNNLDRVYHAAFSVSAAKRFDLGKRSPGATDTITVDRPGIINLHCEIHPDMGGYVVVVPNHAFTFPNDAGQFRLPSLPPGVYTVHVFHPRWGELQRRVVLMKNQDAKLDLAY